MSRRSGAGPPRAKTAPRGGTGRRAPRRDVALCLRRFPYGDSSLVARLLTPSSGKVQLLAKGAFRPTSRAFGVVDLFDELELVWHPRAPGALGLLTEGRVLRRRRAITRDLARYRAALGLLELADLGAREGQEEARLFALLQDGLDALDAPAERGAAPALVSLAFDLHFLDLLGLAPAVEHCASCGEPARGPGRGDVPFSVAAGGRLCRACAADAHPLPRAPRDGADTGRVEAVSLHTLGVARSLMAAPLSSLERVRLASPALQRVSALIQRFLDHHLDTRPRSRRHGTAPRPRATTP